jgi:hypothetical protein
VLQNYIFIPIATSFRTWIKFDERNSAFPKGMDAKPHYKGLDVAKAERFLAFIIPDLKVGAIL